MVYDYDYYFEEIIEYVCETVSANRAFRRDPECNLSDNQIIQLCMLILKHHYIDNEDLHIEIKKIISIQHILVPDREFSVNSYAFINFVNDKLLEGEYTLNDIMIEAVCRFNVEGLKSAMENHIHSILVVHLDYYMNEYMNNLMHDRYIDDCIDDSKEMASGWY